MISLRYRFVGFEELPASLGPQAVQTICSIDPKHLAELSASSMDEVQKLAIAAQYVFLQVTGGHPKSDEAVPPVILTALSTMVLGYETPLATFRAITRFSEDTLKKHRKWVRERLNFKLLDEAGRSDLDRQAIVMARDATTREELSKTLNHWLFDRRVLNPGPRPVDDLARLHFQSTEKRIVEAAKKAVPTGMLKRIMKEMFEPSLEPGMTVLEWLRKRPGKASPSNLGRVTQRIDYLKSLGVHEWDVSAISPVRIEAYAQEVVHHPPSKTANLKDDTVTIQLVCFLVHRLRALTDEAMYRSNRQRGKLHRQAGEKVERRRAHDAGYYRGRMESALTLGEDTSKPLKDRHKAAMAELRGALGKDDGTDAAIVRDILIEDNERVKEILESLTCLDIEGKAGSKEQKLLDAWLHLRDEGLRELPTDFDTSAVPAAWLDLVNDPDRLKARKAFEACVMDGIHKAFQGSRLWVDHSGEFRNRKDMLLSDDEWARDKEKLCTQYNLPIDGKAYLATLISDLKACLLDVAAGVDDGKLEIDEEGYVRLPAISPEDIHPAQAHTDRLMAEKKGTVQISEILLTIDKLTGFSRIILGRRAQDEVELIRLYGALMAHGMLVDVTAVAAMLPQVSESDVARAMKDFENANRLRTANARVVDLQQSFEIVKLWADGTGASSDMMAMDASLHLYKARVNPRRKVMGTGIYTTVLNTYPIIWYQHILQNTWQAGAAVHGAERYNETVPEGRAKLGKNAVDTHGFTYPGMAFAKFCQIELCPQLAHLPSKRLVLPTSMKDGTDVPDAIERIVEYEISDRTILKVWDDILRAVASVRCGRVTAAWFISRMGSAATGDPMKRALDQLGRLLTSIFLADYFTNPAFRREIHTMLNRGESVHTLQRAISPGRIHHSRARTNEAAEAIAAAHALLTNIVIAFKTMRLDEQLKILRAAGQQVDDETIRHIGPGRYGNVNFRGTIMFQTMPYTDHLIHKSRAKQKAATG